MVSRCVKVSALHVLVVTLAAGASAQSFGVRAGLTLTNVNVTEPRQLPLELQWCCSPWHGTRWEGAVGLLTGTNLRPGFDVTTEVLFTRRGFEIDAQRTTPAASLRMSYIEVPILGHVMGDWVHLSAGPMFAIRTSVSQRTTRTSDGVFLDPQALSRSDVGITLGAGVHGGRWSLDGRFVQGFRNVLRAAPAGAGLKHKSLMLIAGFRIAGAGPNPLPTSSRRRPADTRSRVGPGSSQERCPGNRSP